MLNNEKIEFQSNGFFNRLKQSVEKQKAVISFEEETTSLLQKEDERFTSFHFIQNMIAITRFNRETWYREDALLTPKQVEDAVEFGGIKKLVELFEEEILNVE